MIVGSMTGCELFGIFIKKKIKEMVSYGENDEK
nr:MAG TPA: hypothetical protein [Caudoviricetes sp.]